MGRHSKPDSLPGVTGGFGIRVRQQHRELFPTVASDQVYFPYHVPHLLRDDPQHLVAGRVAVGIVVMFEMIDVHQQDSERATLASSPAYLLAQSLLKSAMVGQPCQTVGRRKTLESRVGLFQALVLLLEVAVQTLHTHCPLLELV